MALGAGPKNIADALSAPLPKGLSAVEFTEATTGPLYEWQRPVIESLSASPRPRVAYVQVGRKNGKSRLAAAWALNEMCNNENRQTFLIADSERNLKSALFFELCSMVRNSKILRGAVLVYKDHLECPATGGGVYLRPNNVGASQSINPTGVIFDEVHMQKTDSVWNGMILAGAAFPDALLFGITTPGYEVVSLAHDLYGQVHAGGVWGKIYEAPAGCALDDESALRAANPILADRPEMMDVFHSERAVVSENDYRRFRLGQWTAAATRWLPNAAWNALVAPREYAPGERLWVGFDGSYSGDSSALVACSADGHVKVLGHWQNPNPSTRGWRVPRAEVKAAIARVMTEHPDATLHPDPPYWQSEVAEWDQMWPGRVIEFPTNSPARMAPACSSFEAHVLEGSLSHDGHRQMEAHLSHATPKMTPSGVVIVKPTADSPLKIDLAVAACIAVSQAVIAPPVEDTWVM